MPLTHYYSGKVRDIYYLDESKLVFVTTDRLSAYDVKFVDTIPDKGRVLNQLSLFWMTKLKEIVPNHYVCDLSDDISNSLAEIYDPCWLQERTMIVRRAEMIPLECIVRGYMAGSAWQEYQLNSSICGLRLPKGLKMGDKLPEPIFTPSTKAREGHDINIDIDEARAIVGSSVDKIRRLSLELYSQASIYAESKGIVIADTKFEFGIIDGQITLADEVLTPDSSRFWYKDNLRTGSSPASLDKQFVRDWVDSSGWDHNPPPPSLPDNIIDATRARYIEVYTKLTN
jgi:phosphoribosylaminoimidazole-succinocarboxamide synthase